MYRQSHQNWVGSHVRCKPVHDEVFESVQALVRKQEQYACTKSVEPGIEPVVPWEGPVSGVDHEHRANYEQVVRYCSGLETFPIVCRAS